MTQLELDSFNTLSIEEQMELFMDSSFDIPEWSDLVVQYDPMQHEIMTNKVRYPVRLNPKTGVDDIKRTVFGLQKSAVDKISQALFVTPVKRDYDYNNEKEYEKLAVSVIENIYRTENAIDGSNIERAKKLNASCQLVTIWSTDETPSKIKGIDSKYTLSHSNYSPMDGYDIYAQTNDKGNIMSIAIGYTDSDEKEHLLVYIAGNKPAVIKYEKEDEWVINTEKSGVLPLFPCVYTYLLQPVWGGDSGTNKVEQLEEMETYQGYYVAKNQAPLYVQDNGDTSGMITSGKDEDSEDSKHIVGVGKGGSIKAVEWVGPGAQYDSRFKRLRNAFHEENQLADNSFSTLLGSNTSADNKEIVYLDPKAKAIDLGGEWEKFFLQELRIVKGFCKIMFPTISNDLDMISIRSKVNAYNIRTKADIANYINLAGSSMSLETKVRILNEASDIEQEVLKIQEENGISANVML